MSGILELAGIDPTAMERVNTDEYLNIMQRGFGAPVKMLKSREEIDAGKAQAAENAAPEQQMQGAAQMLEMAKLGGEAAQAVGGGGAAIQQMLQGGQGPAPNVAQAVAA